MVLSCGQLSSTAHFGRPPSLTHSLSWLLLLLGLSSLPEERSLVTSMVLFLTFVRVTQC